MTRCILVIGVVLLALFPSTAWSQCKSMATSDSYQYLSYQTDNYTICYSANHPEDLSYVSHWVFQAFELGKTKYKVTEPTYGETEFKLTLFFPSESNGRTSQGRVTMWCCVTEYNNDVGGTTYAEIHYLTPSAWEGETLGGLGQIPEYYHAHYITHEVSHFFQWTYRAEAREQGYKWLPWIFEGMSESDGYRHTTEYSSTIGISKLNNKVLNGELGSIVCCQGLDLREELSVTDVYWAGGWIMNYLAERFGDEVHIDILQRPLRTVLMERGLSLTGLFLELFQEAQRQERDRMESNPISGSQPILESIHEILR